MANSIQAGSSSPLPIGTQPIQWPRASSSQGLLVPAQPHRSARAFHPLVPAHSCPECNEIAQRTQQHAARVLHPCQPDRTFYSSVPAQQFQTPYAVPRVQGHGQQEGYSAAQAPQPARAFHSSVPAQQFQTPYAVPRVQGHGQQEGYSAAQAPQPARADQTNSKDEEEIKNKMHEVFKLIKDAEKNSEFRKDIGLFLNEVSSPSWRFSPNKTCKCTYAESVINSFAPRVITLMEEAIKMDQTLTEKKSYSMTDRKIACLRHYLRLSGYKMNTCQSFFSETGCELGNLCPYIHHLREMWTDTPKQLGNKILLKTRRCSTLDEIFLSEAECSHGKRCIFAHSDEELKPAGYFLNPEERERWHRLPLENSFF